MYPLDFGYLTSNTNSICDEKIMVPTYGYHNNSNWLLSTNKADWTLGVCSSYENEVFVLSYDSSVTSISAFCERHVRPVLYLKSTAKIKSGSGSSDDPFLLGM